MSSAPAVSRTRTPTAIIGMLTAVEQTAALQAGLRLDLFTAIADGATTAAALSRRLHIAERGAAILCDFLAAHALLEKHDGRYALSPDADEFLNAHSPTSIASTGAWYEYSAQRFTAERVVAAVRQGGSGAPLPPPDTWAMFARSMSATAAENAELMAKSVAAPLLAGIARPQVLDLAGGHGLYGITLAQWCPAAEITLVDAAAVAEVARDNARHAGLGPRHRILAGSLLPGSPDEAALPGGAHLAMITSFCHMFSPEVIESVLRKVRQALAPGGALLVADFLPDEDGASPLFPATFSLSMLLETAEGRCYTEAEFARMFAAAGFSQPERHELGELPFSVLVGRSRLMGTEPAWRPQARRKPR